MRSFTNHTTRLEKTKRNILKLYSCLLFSLILTSQLATLSAQEITVEPNEINIDLINGEVSEHQFRISNPGGDDLIWMVELEWIAVPVNENPNRFEPGEEIAQYEIPYNRVFGLAWDGELIWGVAGYGNAGRGRLFALDPFDGSIPHDFAINFWPVGLAFDGENLWIGQDIDGGEGPDQDMIHLYDRNGEIIEQLDNDRFEIVNINGLASNQVDFVLVNGGGGRGRDIKIVDIENREILGTFSTETEESIYRIDYVDNDQGRQLWATADRIIYQILLDDEWNSELLQTLNIEMVSRTRGLTFDGRNIWLVNSGSDAILSVIDDGSPEISWFKLEPRSGVIRRRREITGTITLDASGMSAGDYEIQIHFLSNARNHRDLVLEVNITIETAPEMDINWFSSDEGNLIDWNEYYDEVFAGGELIVPVRVRNYGTAALRINEIITNAEAFTLQPDELTIEPGESSIIEVAFLPDEEGFYEGEMNIVCNDPGQEEITIELQAEAIAPPEIFIEPMEINEVLEVDETIEHVLNITNNGTSTLRWHVEKEFIRGQEAGEAGTILAQYEIPYHYSSGITFDGEYVWGIFSQENRLIALNPADGSIVRDIELQTSPRGITFDGENLRIAFQEDYRIGIYNRDGELIEWIDGEYGDLYGLSSDGEDHVLLNYHQREWGALVIAVHNLEDFREIAIIDPGTLPFNGFEWVPDHLEGQLWLIRRETAYQCYVDENWDSQIINEYPWPFRSGYSGPAHDGRNFWTWKQDGNFWFVLDDGINETGWIQVDPTTGEVDPFSDADVFITIDPSQCFGGDYETIIHFLNNDPNNPDVAVNVILHVDGLPVLSTEPTAQPFENAIDLQFPNAYLDNEACEMQVEIRNFGNDDLEVQRVEMTNVRDFSTDLEDGSVIAPRDTLNVTVLFNPVETGRREGRLNIFTNASNIGEGDEEGLIWFDIVGVGEIAPALVLEPGIGEEVIAELAIFEEPELHNILIRNDADEEAANLEFSITESILRPLRPNDAGNLLAEYQLMQDYTLTAGLAWDGELMWGTNGHHSRLIAIRPGNNEVEICVETEGLYDTGMIFDGENFWIGMKNSNRVRIVNRNGEMLEELFTPCNDIQGIAFDGENLIFLNSGFDNLMYVITADERQEVARFPFRHAMGNADIWSIELIQGHTDGQLWGLAEERIYQAYVNEDWEVEPVANYEWDIDEPRGIAHDGVNMWLGVKRDCFWKVYDDGIDEFAPIDWLEVEPMEASLEPGSEIEINLTFILNEDEFVYGADYRGELILESNDPQNPRILIPVGINTILPLEHFNDYTPTEESHTIFISDLSYIGNTVPAGWEIGVFTPDDVLAGAVVWQNGLPEPIPLIAYGDNPNTDEVEGFIAREPFVFKAWNPATETESDSLMITFEEGDRFWLPNCESVVSINEIVIGETEVEFIAGWNMISINVIPNDEFWTRDEGPDVILMTEQLQIDDDNHHIQLMKDDYGRFYAPEWNYNNIPYWDLQSGFRIEVAEDISTTWSGNRIAANADVNLNPGWNISAYYPEYNLDASAPDCYALSPIIDHVVIAKDGNGNFMSPGFNFSNMPPWRKSQGYQIKVDADVVLNYPAEDREEVAFSAGRHPRLTRSHDNYRAKTAENTNRQAFTPPGPPLLRRGGERQVRTPDGTHALADASSNVLADAPVCQLSHWQIPAPTGESQSLLINSITGIEAKSGDQIGAFNADGNIVGIGNVETDGRCGLAVWGDDETTEEKDGLRAGERFELVYWDADNTVEFQLEASEFISGNNLEFCADELIVLDTEAQPLIPNDFILKQNYPNPFNSVTKISFGLPDVTELKLQVFDISGRVVSTIADGEYKAGYHNIVWNAEISASGVYFINLQTEFERHSIKVVLVR